MKIQESQISELRVAVRVLENELLKKVRHLSPPSSFPPATVSPRLSLSLSPAGRGTEEAATKTRNRIEGLSSTTTSPSNEPNFDCLTSPIRPHLQEPHVRMSRSVGRVQMVDGVYRNLRQVN
jgi:hypothetical protein